MSYVQVFQNNQADLMNELYILDYTADRRYRISSR
jgi:hypothetical protein